MGTLVFLLMFLGAARSRVVLGPDTQSQMPGEETRAGQVLLGGGVTTPCDLDVTFRGNGSLTVNGMSIRVVDSYDDTTLFLFDRSVFGCIPEWRPGDGLLFNAGLFAVTDEKADRLVHAVVPFLRLYVVHGGQRPVRIFASPTPVGDEYWGER